MALSNKSWKLMEAHTMVMSPLAIEIVLAGGSYRTVFFVEVHELFHDLAQR
jgi:hypothetical protein